LERQINNLKFQILLKEKDINYYASKSVILEKQNSGLRQEVRKVESEIKQKDSVIHDLKEQMSCLKKKRLDYEILKKKLSQKEKELQQYKQYVLIILYNLYPEDYAKAICPVYVYTRYTTHARIHIYYIFVII
jgi:TRAF-interacting protein